jgi:hypothetical protein
MQTYVLMAALAAVMVGLYFAATAPVGEWRYKRKARSVLRHLIRHYEAAERRAA